MIEFIKEKVKIIVYGSYHPTNKPILDSLVKYLKDKGFQDTKLALDLITIPEKGLSEDYEAIILTQIEELMNEVDFNIFVLFPKENNSTLIELTSLIKSDMFSTKKDKTLVILNRNYNVSMLLGLLKRDEINTFRYDSAFEICRKAYIFIRQNLFV
jgi:hypothetical protein